ncbi:nuclear envelope integral membrane protein 1a-like isoform X1 [Lucilia sericata]|uniref:nuclear envelope integral membrane protein 1a-like isoform X1 n=1 Tax=Lucilia sericata TaxID=13632 RepID=UPI0018A860D2|nr:nuclear envelope integral membrane protein 1a-like isoform X1 [Lucilia sericata]
MTALFFKLILIGILIIPKSLTNDINIKIVKPISKPTAKPVDKFKVLFLEANTTFNFKPSKRGFFEKHLNTYCYKGEPKTLGRLLETIELQLEIEGDDYTQYEGTTPSEVEEHYSEHRSIFSLNLFSQKRSRVSLSPFMQQCIGIETVQPYNVTLYQEKIDYYRTVQLMSGIIMFLFAGVLSANSLFYYITGILFGICSSFLFLIWLSGKLMPKRTMMYGVLIGGWTVGFYVIRMLWDNIQMIMLTYRNYVCWYIIVTGIISFFFCYRWGPPQNRRSKNIIKWLLQLMSLAMIYLSSNFKEATIAIILMTVTLYYFPRILKRIMSLRTKTSKEYLNEKNVYGSGGSGGTRDLRDDCQQWRVNSPQYKDWKIKPKSRTSLSGVEQRRTPTQQPIIKTNINNSGSKQNLEDFPSGLENVNLEGHDLTTHSLYPLPDGSFILSEKTPIIITPRLATPIYHRSTPAFSNDEDEDEAEGDYTPKNHHTHVPLPAHYRRLSAAASTSDLLLSAGRRRATPSPSQLQRSSSVQRVQSRSARMISSARKHHASNPKIKIDNPTSDDD